ncbi:MAG: hypothetical protein AABX23_05330, partial [Nanoarchaeota archaeon]
MRRFELIIFSLIFLLFMIFILLYRDSLNFSPDSSALLAPTELHALALNSSALRITWNDNGDSNSNFMIERRSLPDGEFSFLSTSTNSINNLEMFIDIGLTPNSSFEYVITAFNSTDISSPSNPIQATTLMRDTELILTPNFGSLDFLDLFTDVQSWEYVKANLDGFGFFYHNLKTNPQCSASTCGNVNYDNLVAVDAFSKLRQWELETSIEVDVVKWHSCIASERTIPAIQQIITNVENAGGRVDSIFMDQPLNGGQEIICLGSNGARIVSSCSSCVSGETCRTCGYTMQQSASQTAQYIKALRAWRPGIKIGDTEPYSKFSPAQIQLWIEALNAENVTLDSFRSDVGSRQTSDIPNLRQIKNFFIQQNIPYGIIYWAFVPNNFLTNRDREFFTRVSQWVNFVDVNKLDGQIHNFQSWDTSPAGSTNPGQTVPINLPEDDLSIYSHTRLMRENLGILLDNDAQFVSQQALSNIIAGQQYNVAITLLNNGSQPWEEGRSYTLGSQNPRDNTNWGTMRVALNPGEVIFPGQQKTFNFLITAPSVIGSYNFQWQMLHESIEWFGDLTPNVQVNVLRSSLPNSPSDLNVTPVSSIQLRLNWKDNSDNEMNFRVERRQLPSGSF